MHVLLENAAQPELLAGARVCEDDKIAMEHLVGLGAEDVGETAGHSRAKVQTERTEHEDDAASHVFAAVLADTFNYGKGAAVADAETLAGASCDIELARCCAVENGISGENVATARRGRPGRNGNRAARHAFADVVVGFAGELQGNTIREE